MLQGRLKCGRKIQTILLCKLSVATIEQFISAHFQFNNAGQIVYINDAKLLNSSYILYIYPSVRLQKVEVFTMND